MDWLLIFLLVPFGLLLWQLAEALAYPLNRRSGNQTHFPPVTILKPLKGCDALTHKCLDSWLTLDYPGPVQVFFGVADPKDPVCELVKELIQQRQIATKFEPQLVICEQNLGPNAKVSTLVQLERLAQHEILVISDADVLVPPDLLRELVVPLEGSTDLVNYFYRLANPANLAMRLEAFATNSDFWSQVLQARRMGPLDFALGAVMATTRDRLAKAGGFTALLDYLADDYQLGHRIAGTGGPVVISPVIVECWNAPMSPREVWAHQVRWARTIRVCRPGSYFLSILSNTTLWPLLFFLVHPSQLAAWCLAAILGARMLAGFLMERKYNGRGDWNAFWMAPVKDLLSFLVWASAFVGSEITWSGKRFRVLPGGKLLSLES